MWVSISPPTDCFVTVIGTGVLLLKVNIYCCSKKVEGQPSQMTKKRDVDDDTESVQQGKILDIAMKRNKAYF